MICIGLVSRVGENVGMSQVMFDHDVFFQDSQGSQERGCGCGCGGGGRGCV